MRYEAETEGIEVVVRPRFSLARSDLSEGTYVFAYEVDIRNGGADLVQLVFRHWRIRDSGSDDTVVDGEGVVGEQPVLAPGTSYAYSSFCVLRSPVGHMDGYYTFRRVGGEEFQVRIPRFPLEAPLPPPDPEEGVHLEN